MTLILLSAVAFFLAYANGANDTFKGVASLFGGGGVRYRTALAWATLTTFSGALTSAFVAQGLVARFSGRGLVPDAVAADSHFLIVIAFAAAATVLLASLVGLPISTTHALIGAIVGAGMIATGGWVNVASLRSQFLLPLLLSPVLAPVLTGVIYGALRLARLSLSISKESCVCAGSEVTVAATPDGAAVADGPMTVSVQRGTLSECGYRYGGTFVGVSAQRVVDVAHFVSAGAIGFARGLNDTPKIVAVLAATSLVQGSVGFALVASAMALGGVLHSRRLATTLSVRITEMPTGTALAANFATAALVLLASAYTVPVSTTHVSAGSLFGIGLISRRANWPVIGGIVLAWVVTLPCAAAIAAMTFVVLFHHS